MILPNPMVLDETTPGTLSARERFSLPGENRNRESSINIVRAVFKGIIRPALMLRAYRFFPVFSFVSGIPAGPQCPIL